MTYGAQAVESSIISIEFPPFSGYFDNLTSGVEHVHF